MKLILKVSIWMVTDEISYEKMEYFQKRLYKIREKYFEELIELAKIII